MDHKEFNRMKNKLPNHLRGIILSTEVTAIAVRESCERDGEITPEQHDIFVELLREIGRRMSPFLAKSEQS